MIALPLAYEPSGRGVDIETESMAELFDTLSSLWPIIPIALVLIFTSWLILKDRHPHTDYDIWESRSKKEEDSWFCFQDGDKWYTKVWIVILWIVTIIAGLGGVYTLIQIILRILLGSIFTFIEWIFLWLASILALLLVACLPAAIVYSALEKHVKWLAIILGIVFLIGGFSLIIYFWDPIIDWEWTFPAFPSFNVYRF